MDFWVILRTVNEGESCGIGFIAIRERKKDAISIVQQVICLKRGGDLKILTIFCEAF